MYLKINNYDNKRLTYWVEAVILWYMNKRNRNINKLRSLELDNLKKGRSWLCDKNRNAMV